MPRRNVYDTGKVATARAPSPAHGGACAPRTRPNRGFFLMWERPQRRESEPDWRCRDT